MSTAETHDASNVVSDVLLGAGLVVGGTLLLLLVVGAVAVAFGFLVAPRVGRPLAYTGRLGVLEALMRPFAWVVHRAEYRGFHAGILPQGGFVLVANHGSGLDAPLMQCAVHRPVRFMMAADQMSPAFKRLWKGLDVLPVHYGPQDSTTLKLAVKHVRDGGIVGIFPERGIVEQPGTIEPFAEGVGALVALAKVPVVLLWIHGPGTTGNALIDPLVPRGKAVVELVGVFDFAKEEVREPAEVCKRLRHALAKKSGWPMVDPEPVGGAGVG